MAHSEGCKQVDDVAVGTGKENSGRGGGWGHLMTGFLCHMNEMKLCLLRQQESMGYSRWHFRQAHNGGERGGWEVR